jgi:PKD repeat protein
VKFTGSSVSAGKTSYLWDLNNDGVVDCTTAYANYTPVFTYKTAGNYTVKLTVTNAFGTDSEIKTNYIHVALPVTAQFISNATYGKAPLTVKFTDQSVSPGLTSYQWDINNDGIADYTTQNPVHTYQTQGTYTVKLTVTNAFGQDSKSKTNYVTVTSPSTTETFGAEQNPTGNPIGGGASYSRIITSTDSSIDYIVTSYSELIAALNSEPGIIYIPETANINMSGHFATNIPEGFTLASNRGESGSLGGRIFQIYLPTDPETNPTMLWLGNNTRVTGVRIEGPHTGTDSVPGIRSGLMVSNVKGVEIDNCNISGWSLSGVTVRSIGRPDLVELGLGTDELGVAIANIHNNYIHHCQASLGYGVMIDFAGSALVKANIFDYTRHAISSSGNADSGYEASYNIHLGNTTHNIFDVHPYPYTTPPTPGAIAGDTYKIHHNTFYSSQPTENHVESYAVIIRAVPVHGVWIDHNRMQWNGEFGGTLYPPVVQSDGIGRVYMTRNLIGPDQTLYPEGPIDLR